MYAYLLARLEVRNLKLMVLAGTLKTDLLNQNFFKLRKFYFNFVC